MLEKRTSKLEQEGSKLVGYAAVYAPALSEDLGGFREKISPGAFDKSLESNADIRALWDHNTSQPLARTTNGSLKVSSDKRGLRVEIELPEGVSYADDLRQLVRSGVVNQMSFGFLVPPGGDTWDKDEDGNALRTLNSIDLHEVSVVSIPAYPDTTVALRGLRHVEFDIRRARWLASHGYRAASVLFSDSKEIYMEKVTELKKLIDERAALIEQIRALTPEEQAAMDALVQGVADLDARVAAIEEAMDFVPEEEAASADKAAEAERTLDLVGARCASLLEKLESQTTRRSKPMPLNTPYIVKDVADKNYHNDRKLAMRGWFLEGNGRATDAHRAAAERVGVSLRSRDFNVRLFDTAPRSRRELEERGTATQVAGTGSLGGFNVPTVLVERIEKALLYFSPLREYAQVLRTESGEPMTMPTNDDTGTKGVLLAEDGALTVADTSFGQISLGAYTMSSKALKVSWQLLDDNAVDLETYIGDLLGERLGRIMADYVATGTGSSQPTGIAASTAGKTTASATAITSAEILDLIHSVDIAYRQDPSCALVMHDSVWLYVRKLVDSNGQPLFQESYRIPGEIRIHGFPLVISNSLNSAITTGLKTMVFGAMNKFLIRDVANIRIQRLDELYAANGAVGFTAWARTDSKILASGAIKHMVQA
jgi:HK97 family phage major capsid protein/HK97 family phage prohead protease